MPEVRDSEKPKRELTEAQIDRIADRVIAKLDARKDQPVIADLIAADFRPT